MEAAANTAAQDTIVSGFDAVAASEVPNARRGVATSAVASPPMRTRNALQSVRAPSQASTAPPASPSARCSGSSASSDAAPAAPAAA